MKTNDKATPRTDKQSADPIGFYSCATVPADFARQLEREVNAMNAVAEAAKDMQDFISAIVDATQNCGKIDENSIMRLGERLKTTAVRCNSKAINALTALDQLLKGGK